MEFNNTAKCFESYQNYWFSIWLSLKWLRRCSFFLNRLHSLYFKIKSQNLCLSWNLNKEHIHGVLSIKIGKTGKCISIKICLIHVVLLSEWLDGWTIFIKNLHSILKLEQYLGTLSSLKFDIQGKLLAEFYYAVKLNL